MTDEELDTIWQALYRTEHYMMPYSTGDWVVYHHDTHKHAFMQNDLTIYYEIIHPRKFRLNLFYENNLVRLAKDMVRPYTFPYKDYFVDIPMQIKLEDYFEIADWRGRKIPTSVKRFETEYKVERLFNLFVFA